MTVSYRFQDRLTVICILLTVSYAFQVAPSGRPARVPPTLFSSQQQQQHTAYTVPSSPLAEFGDWQAFFDDDRYCLVYYFNSRTGTSQWEPPPNFPIPAVPWEDEIAPSPTESTRSKQQTLEKQFDKGHSTAAAKVENKKEKPSAFAWLVKGALHVASDLLEKQHQKEVKEKSQKESKPWWSFLVDDDEPVDARKREAPVARKQQEPSFWNRLFGSPKTEPGTRATEARQDFSSTKPHQSGHDNRSSMRVMQQQHTEWLKFLDDGDSPTIPLVPPSEREAKLQRKLYADSLARQENLRRNYKAVQEHRSRTFSLSALKRNSQQAKDWHQYMDE